MPPKRPDRRQRSAGSRRSTSANKLPQHPTQGEKRLGRLQREARLLEEESKLMEARLEMLRKRMAVEAEITDVNSKRGFWGSAQGEDLRGVDQLRKNRKRLRRIRPVSAEGRGRMGPIKASSKPSAITPRLPPKATGKRQPSKPSMDSTTDIQAISGQGIAIGSSPPSQLVESVPHRAAEISIGDDESLDMHDMMYGERPPSAELSVFYQPPAKEEVLSHETTMGIGTDVGFGSADDVVSDHQFQTIDMPVEGVVVEDGVTVDEEEGMFIMPSFGSETAPALSSEPQETDEDSTSVTIGGDEDVHIASAPVINPNWGQPIRVLAAPTKGFTFFDKLMLQKGRQSGDPKGFGSSKKDDVIIPDVIQPIIPTIP